MEYGNLYGLEATPAESATFRFARLDRERFSGIRTAGHEGDVPYYTNSTKLPADYDGTLQDALINQDSLQPLYTTGTVFHVYMERELEDWRKARDLLSGMITEHCTSLFHAVSCLHHLPDLRLSARQTGALSEMQWRCRCLQQDRRLLQTSP